MGEGSSRNYYELLGLARDATTEQVRDAYREIARVYHPDSNFYTEIIDGKASGSAVERFKELTAAYHTLSSAEKRRAYDATLPGPMTDWNDDTDARNSYRPEPRANVRTWGVFGVVQNPVDHAEREEAAEPPSLIRRVLAAFGL
jgi:DnaJ-class molecular chaperone